jgi:peptide/nickel transport system permease protein
MIEKPDVMTDFQEAPPRVSEWRRFRRVFLSRGVVVFGLVVLIILFLVAIFATWLAPYDPYKPSVGKSLEQPSTQHLLGTDKLGRDTLSRIIYGSRTALMVGFISVTVAGIIGVTLGVIAGYVGGFTNAIIMRTMDALLCFPMLLLALVVSAVLGGGISNVMLRHILPNAFPPLIVLITMQLGALILAEAGLSFLGIGIEPPGAAWGAMVNDGYQYLLRAPVLSFAPCIAIMLVVFAFNMVGDGLRDALDPRLRGLL